MSIRFGLGLATCLGCILWGCATTSKTSDVPSGNQATDVAPSEQVAIPDATQPSGPQANGEDSAKVSSPEEQPAPPPEVDNYPPEVEQAFAQAFEASKQGDYDSAEQVLREVLRNHRNTPMAYTNLGVIHERRGQLEKAEEYYRSAIKQKPGQQQAWDNLTRLLFRQNRGAQIEKEIRAALSSAPSAMGPRLALSIVLIHQKRPAEAEVEIKAVLKRDEKNVRAMEILAQTYYLQGKFELARLVLENARAIAPEQATVHNWLGLVNLSLKAKAVALENFKQATSLQPSFVEALNNLASLLIEQQDFEVAATQLETAVGLAPDFVAARLNLANAYRGLLRADKALPLYEEVLRQAPQMTAVYFQLAILYLDSELTHLSAIDRLKTSVRYMDEFERLGGKDERIARYKKDAQKAIEKEERKLEREKRDSLKTSEDNATPPASTEATTP